jgi:cbb3-type cytochrome oxidase maturation protein
MTSLAWLIPVTLLLGGIGLCAFLWALRAGQFEDLEGASYRALDDDPPDSLQHDPPASAGEQTVQQGGGMAAQRRMRSGV